MPESSAPDLAGVAAGFANLLHAAGVSVAPDRAGRWAAAVRLARPATTNELYWLGRVTLTLDPNEIAVYDAVFASVFRGLTDVADSRSDQNASPIRVSTRREPPGETELDAGGARPSLGAARSSFDDDATARPTARPAPATPDEVLRRRDFADCTQTSSRTCAASSPRCRSPDAPQSSPPTPPPRSRRRPPRH